MSANASRAVKELLSTEKTYVEALHHMLDVYYRPLRDLQFGLKPILKEHEIDVIFGNVEDLLVIADQLFSDLRSRIESHVGDDTPRVGDIMCRTAPLLQLYEKYVKNYEKAVHRLAECREKGRTRAELTTFLDENQGTDGMSLDSYLIMPVQRILRYKMLLEEIHKHTDISSPDFHDLNTALGLVAARAVQCNEATRRQENTMALRRIQQALSGVEIVNPNRILLREGNLTRLRPSRKDPRENRFILFNDALMYVTVDILDKLDKKFFPGLGSRDKFTLKRKFDIGELHKSGKSSNRITVNASHEGGRMIRVVDREDDTTAQNAFDIITSKKAFTVCSQTPEEKRAWMTSLEAALAANKSDKTYSAVAVPLATSETEAKACQVCQVKFTSFLQRRNQCRRCGLSVCSKCSIELDQHGTGLQILSKTGVKVEQVNVVHPGVTRWHDDLRRQAMQLNETIDKVRVCHKCLYGGEYNRKDEIGYLRWIKVEKLYQSDGYKNFRSQPGKQAIIASYHSQVQARDSGSCLSPNTRKRQEEQPGSGGAPNLTVIESIYKQCESCGQTSFGCTCKRGAARAARAHGSKGQAVSAEMSAKLGGAHFDEISGRNASERTPSGGQANDSADGITCERVLSGESSVMGERTLSAASSTYDIEEGGEDKDSDDSDNNGEGVVLYSVRALYDYEGSGGDTELPLVQDLIVEVLTEPNEDGWAYGRRPGSLTEGYFPMNYCQVVESSSRRSSIAGGAGRKASAESTTDDDFGDLVNGAAPSPSVAGLQLRSASSAATSSDAPFSQPPKPLGAPIVSSGGGVREMGGSALQVNRTASGTVSVGGMTMRVDSKDDVMRIAQEKIAQAQRDFEDMRRLEQAKAEAAHKKKPFERNTMKERAIGVVLKMMGNDADGPGAPVRNAVPLDIVHMGHSVELKEAESAVERSNDVAAQAAAQRQMLNHNLPASATQGSSVAVSNPFEGTLDEGRAPPPPPPPPPPIPAFDSPQRAPQGVTQAPLNLLEGPRTGVQTYVPTITAVHSAPLPAANQPSGRAPSAAPAPAQGSQPGWVSFEEDGEDLGWSGGPVRGQAAKPPKKSADIDNLMKKQMDQLLAFPSQLLGSSPAKPPPQHPHPSLGQTPPAHAHQQQPARQQPMQAQPQRMGAGMGGGMARQPSAGGGIVQPGPAVGGHGHANQNPAARHPPSAPMNAFEALLMCPNPPAQSPNFPGTHFVNGMQRKGSTGDPPKPLAPPPPPPPGDPPGFKSTPTKPSRPPPPPPVMDSPQKPSKPLPAIPRR